ncbi:hypothetical protein LIER_31407 [Lithospermum erythrorhizon]|uniref:Uncharacterized protein n=1 Tax=Lithospermum erythrorhizon TaxID=34254 RepID=A0AAV3RSZ5_LITER
MGLGDVADLRGKLQGFFQEARKMIAASIVVSLADTSKTFQKLSLLRVSLEDQALRKQCEVQKIEKLEHEVVELETRARDLRVHIQEQKSVISQLDLGTSDTSGQLNILEKESQTEQANHQGRLPADLEVARLGLVGLL